MKIGIIGIGFAGQLHSKVIEMFCSDIYYVYDLTAHVAQEFAKTHKCQAVNTLDELYDKTDAVIIATPTFTHYSLVMEAMQKGKHVLCEKPMSLRVDESEKMLAMSREKNLICAIGFNYRFFEITEILKKQNLIGETMGRRIKEDCYVKVVKTIQKYKLINKGDKLYPTISIKFFIISDKQSAESVVYRFSAYLLI